MRICLLKHFIVFCWINDKSNRKQNHPLSYRINHKQKKRPSKTRNMIFAFLPRLDFINIFQIPIITSKYCHILSMSSIRDLKFLSLLNKIDARYSQKEFGTIKQMLNSEIIKFQLNNPFLLHPFPSVTPQQISIVFLFMAKQMEEVAIKNMSLAFLEHFVRNNYETIVNILIEKPFHCQIFCMAIIRWLQEHAKTKELCLHLNKLKLNPFIDLFSTILEKKKTKKMVKAIKAEEKQSNNQIHTLFHVLFFIVSAKYVKELDQEQLQSDKFMERSLTAACLMIEQCEREDEFEGMREYLSVVSHLLIFNGLALKPLKWLDFCLDNNQGLYLGLEYNLIADPTLVQKYIKSLYDYSMLDFNYQLTLLKITKNLLALNINNPMLITHFQILLDLIKCKLFPHLKKQLCDILLYNQNKRNIAVVDQIFIRLLSSGTDLLDDDIQRFNLLLAESGENKRKEQFVLVYYYHYEKSSSKIQPQVINFIFEIYLEQDLPLQKIELMISKEANIIQSSNIKKLHAIINEKNLHVHLNLLSIILEKRRDSGCFRVSKRASHLFLCEDWLLQAGSNSEIYKTYLKIITETYSGKSLEIYPSFINIGSLIVKVSLQQYSQIHSEYFIRSLEFYSILMKMAEKNNVFEEMMFRYMILLHALLGEKLSSESYSYFSRNFSKIVHPQSTFFTFLEYLVVLLKNKSSVLLYLQAVLEFQTFSNELFFQKKLFDLSFLAQKIEESEFFRLSTYSMQSVTVLYELSLLVKDESFQEDYLTIMKCWSKIMSRMQCKNLSYFFAFREIKKIYPFMKERQMKDPSDRIKLVWDLILKFLAEERQKQQSYILMSSNKIIIEWKGDEQSKRGVKVAGSFLRNQSTELHWFVHIETKDKIYMISLNNQRMIIQTRNINQENREVKEVKEVLKEQTIKQFKKRPEMVQFQLKIQNQNKKLLCNLRVHDFELMDLTLDGNAQEIKIGCKNNAILKNIKFFDGFLPGQIYGMNSHIQYLNRWEIKIASLSKIVTQSFSEKFDYDHAYCCIGQMLRNFDYINLPFAYDIFIRISTMLIEENNSCNFSQLQVMMQVFNIIEGTYANLKGRCKSLQPVIEFHSAKQYPKELYYLFVSALLPTTFWNNFSEQTRLHLTTILKELLKNPDFSQIQNRKLILFDQSLKISAEFPYFFEICETILNNHELNQTITLNRKFKKFLQLAKQFPQFKQYFSDFLQRILQYLNLQNGQFQQKRLICKFLIVESENIKEIFQLCKTKSKIDLLHYYSQNPSFDQKGQPNSLILIKELIQLIDITKRDEVLPWLIIEVQQLIFRKKNLVIFEENKYSCRINHLYMELLLLNRNIGNEEQRYDVLKFIIELLQIIKLETLQSIFKGQLQAFFHFPSYLSFIMEITKEIIDKYGSMGNCDKDDAIVKIYELSMDIICRFEKRNFLEFITKYRYRCSVNFQLLKALIQHDQFKNLRLWQYSIFLQYLFEILLLIEQKSALTFKQCQDLIKSIKSYLEFILITLDEKCKLQKALFYSYPRLAGHKETMFEKSKVVKEARRVQKNGIFLQLRGGIYFKCVLIIIKLMKFSPNEDFNNLVEYFLIGPKNNAFYKQDKGFKVLTKVSFDLIISPKERSAIQPYIADAHEGHKLYFNKDDFPYNRQNEQTDLTPYITDYLLMSIAEFLVENSQKLELELLQKYNYNYLRGSSSQKIGRELLVSSGYYQFVKYDDLIKFLQPIKRTKTLDDHFSPGRRNLYSNFPTLEEFPRRDSQFQIPTSPRRPVARRGTEDFPTKMNKRAQIFSLIISDSRSWFKKQHCKKIPAFSCEKAKEIRLIELIHTHYVLKNEIIPQNIVSTNKIKEGKEAFLKKYGELLKLQKQQMSGEGLINLEEKIRKVKKIYPYTSSKSPVLNIIQNCIGNMTCPITLKITKQDYDIRRSKNQESIYMNQYLSSNLTEEASSHIIEEQVEKYDQVRMDVDNVNESLNEELFESEESIMLASKQKPYCELITRQGAYFCEYSFEPTFLVLTSKLQRPESDRLWYLKLGTPSDNLLHAQIRIQIKSEDVVQIFYRRFNQITNNSIQFFMKNGTSRFISFYRKHTLASQIKNIERVFKGVKIIKDPIKEFQDSRFTQKWVEGYLSNFDYLMLLNKYSGRTYNDLNQYYVFPWILQDYHSEKIDLTNHEIYRDLNKPIGALNPEKFKRYKEKFKTEAFNNQRCLYGSHYSTSLFVFYYLVRLEPYSSLHREMQKGNWDVADRLFNSVDQVWESLLNESNTSDIKECIPQFYYMPAFLKNIANIQLGQKQCGSDVGDVELPPWAASAQEFVVTLRAALQSDYVSENLHHWIDLIFGKYQNSQQKHNIFHPYSYSDPEVLNKMNKNNTNIEGIICQISYFGQCPIQLFKRQHKPKKTFSDVRPNRTSTYGKSQSTISQIVIGEAYLLPGWRIVKITSENTQFILDLENTTKQERQASIISAFATNQELKESLQDLIPIKKNETKSSSEPKVILNNRKELYLGKEFLIDLDVKFNFDHAEMNELWIACYGCKGVRVYNWQLQLKWTWQSQEVKEVHLQVTRMIFSTPSGKLYCYSFLDRRIQETIVFKQSCDLTIKVICLPRLPTRQKNQTSYKILCIGDGMKVSIVSFSFQETSNYTSQLRSIIY